MSRDIKKVVMAGVCAIAFLLLVVVSCRSKKQDEFTIAIVSSLTGDLAENGIDTANGAKMAFEESESTGLFSDKKITVQMFDDEADPKVAVSIANRICQDSAIIAVVGHLTSGCMSAAAPVYARNKMPVVMPVPTNPEISAKGHLNLFRVPPTDDEQAPFLAAYLISHDSEATIAVVHDMTTYGEGFATAFRKAFVEGGREVVAFEGSEEPSKDYRTIIAKIKSASPKYIVLGATYDMGAPFVRQMRELGLSSTVLAGDGCYGSQFLKLAGNAAEGTIVSFIAPDRTFSDKTAQFFDRYEAKYGKVVSFAPLGFDAGMVVSEALLSIKAPSREKLIERLHQSDFVVDGVTGKISFAENGDNKYATLVLYQVINGKWVLLQQ